MTNKILVNPTDAIFNWTWNNEAWSFEPKCRKTLPAYLADHFASHLVDSMLLQDGHMVDDWRREEYLAKVLISIEGQEEMSAEKAVAESLNEKEEIGSNMQPAKRMGSPPKKLVEEKFEGLETKE